MTEVPEHLLQRSKERRAALGGGGDDGGGGSPTPAAASGGDEPSASAPARAATPAAAAPAVVEAAAPPPPPPYVQAALARKKVPVWMTPVGIAAALWAFIYAGVLFAPAATLTDPVLIAGQEIFQTQCAGCHGAQGQGGTGRPLAGEALLTFPNIADHIAWVVNGSPAKGTPYGDPARPGGQHVSQDGFGAMPPFGRSLSPEQINAVVRYEREVLNDEKPGEPAPAGGSTGGSDSSTTSTTGK